MLFIIMRKIIIIIASILLFPSTSNVALNKIIENEERLEAKSIEFYNVENESKMNGIFIYTKYNGIEKTTPILEAIFNGIDVDNDESTGIDGKDIKISIFILPHIQKLDGKWILAISLALKVIRLGEEIKKGEIEITFEGNFAHEKFHHIKIGYYSKQGEEIPKEIRIVYTVLPYLFYEKNPEFYINMEPVFEGKNYNISLIAEYGNEVNHRLTIEYYPAVLSIIKISPDISFRYYNFSIIRFAEEEQAIKITYSAKKTILLSLENLPKEISFTIGYGEYFEYKASREFNASLVVEFKEYMVAMKIYYLPRHLVARSGENYLSIYINSIKTKFIICNDLEMPTSYFSIKNLSGETTLRWLGGKEGYIAIDGMKGVEIEIFSKKDISLKFFSVQKAKHFIIKWNISSKGYVFVDTNWEWLSFYSFNLTIDNIFGILIEANLLKAENFTVSWQRVPPSFVREGKIDFIGDITFAIMFNGVWYRVF